MPKSTPQRVRALRDRINLRGRSELLVEEKIKCLGEIISTYTFSGRDLRHVHDQIVKLKARHPELNEAQKVLLAELQDRYTKRETWIKVRVEKKRRGEPLYRKKQEPTPAPATDLMELWSKAFKEENNSGSNT